MQIRELRGRGDVRGVASVHGESWRAAYEGLLPEEFLRDVSVDPSEEAVDEWAARLRSNEAGIRVAVDDGTVRGFADVRWGDVETKSFVGARDAELKAIYVDPEYWGRGVGTRLLEAALDLLPDDVEVLRLAVLAGNDRGRRFYEARGFERTGSAEYEIGGENYPTAIYSLTL
jgi:ribosomal protein S18 acetylase RimI-like enzyme